jgi:hypothetical protein
MESLGTSVEELEALAAASGRAIAPIDEPNEYGIFHALLARNGRRPSAQP